MRIFVTGATGFVGSAIVRELVDAGHRVVGLARSDKAEAELVAAGAQTHRGALEDLDGLRAGAAAADAVIHTAFNHDFSRFAASCAADANVILTLGEALLGSDRPLIVTSAMGILPQGGLVTEDTPPVSSPHAHPRAATEEAARELEGRGVRVAVVRLSPSVHGDGDHGFVPALISIARQTGVSVCVGDGSNRWPAVHRLDAARLYRLVVEQAGVSGVYHAVAEEGVVFRDIAGVIGRRLGIAVELRSTEDAAAHFGWMAHFAAMDIPASSQRTRNMLGWRPEQPGLLVDMDRPGYFGG